VEALKTWTFNRSRLDELDPRTKGYVVANGWLRDSD